MKWYDVVLVGLLAVMLMYGIPKHVKAQDWMHTLGLGTAVRKECVLTIGSTTVTVTDRSQCWKLTTYDGRLTTLTISVVR